MNFKETDKVWIYTSKDEFSNQQIEMINNIAADFLSKWESHGEKVIGTVRIYHNRFIVIIADDCGGNMCGRAQDAQVNLIKTLEQELQTTLLDRMLIAYRNENDAAVSVKPMIDFKNDLKNGLITSNTIVFDNSITHFKDFDTSWEKPIKDSWHAQLL